MNRISQASVLILLCALALSVYAACTPEFAAQEALTAGQILRQVGVIYAGSTSYTDTGVVTTRFIKESGTHIDQTPFFTAFVRPDRFRFEFSHRHEFGGTKGAEHPFIIWRSGKDVRTWWDLQPGGKDRAMDSLRQATGVAAGVSSGTSYIISNLLLPKEVSGPPLTHLVGAQRIEDARLDNGVDCFRLQGQWPVDDPATLWIEKQTFLVRRIDRSRTGPVRTETTITYEPVLNGPVPEKILAFNPPIQK